jgi:hypothetical protein
MRKLAGLVLAALVSLGGGAAASASNPAGFNPGGPMITVTALPVAYGFAPCNNFPSFGCPEVRPHSIRFGQGGSPIVDRLAWSWWTHANAQARARVWIDDCEPNCAQDAYVPYPGSMYLYNVLRHGTRRYFERMNLRWTEGRVHHLQVLNYTRHGGTLVFWG